MGSQEMIYAAVASVIGGLALLSMFAVQQRGQDASIDAVQYRTAKSSLLGLVEIIERDFQNMGAHMYWNGTEFVGSAEDPANVLPNAWYDSTDLGYGMRYSFQFRSQTDSLQAPTNIEYRWEPIDGETITLEDGTVRQLFQVSRFSGGNLSYREESVTEFDVEILPDTTVDPILVNLEDARIFKVAIQGISPFGKGETVEEIRFDATYRPIGLTITDNLN